MLRVVICGVSGCGKSTIGKALSQSIDATFVDADDLHPEANVQKMSRGEPLNDDDRRPWLEEVGRVLSQSTKSIVIACSALKRSYRDAIRTGSDDTVFVFLSGSKELIAQRMAERQDHFMPPSLLESQFAALESFDPDENFVQVDIARTVDEILCEILDQIKAKRLYR